MNLEIIERLSKVHTTLVENLNSISSCNKAYGGYGGVAKATSAAENVAERISYELGAKKEDS